MTDALVAPSPSIRERVFGATKREKYQDAQLEQVHDVLNRFALAQENAEINGYSTIAEGLGAIDMMIDAQGWTNVFDYDEKTGLTLKQIKEASEQLRELLASNPFMKNGHRIRSANTWGGGLEFSCRNRTGSPASRAKTRPLPGNIEALMEEVRNQRYIFGNDAHEEQEGVAFTDGMAFVLGHDETKRMQRLQIHELTADLRNPNNTEEIWAYRRVWSQNPNGETPEAKKEMVRWYYTDIYDGARKRYITHMGKREQIENKYTIIDKKFNGQVGWAYGAPDALVVLAWSRLYKEFLVNGFIMSRSLARLAFKITSSSVGGATKASTEISMPGQAGATAVEGTGNTLSPLLTAGKGYDFGSGSPLAAAMAAGLGVSLLALTANPAAASGSNAAASTLDPIAKATAAVRRRSWDDYWVRVFRWMGLTQKLVVTWHDLQTDSINRILQADTLVHNSGLFEGRVVQKLIADHAGIADPGEIPAGYNLPNNANSLSRKDIDSDGQTTSPTAGSGQGVSSPAGQGDDDHDDDE